MRGNRDGACSGFLRRREVDPKNGEVRGDGGGYEVGKMTRVRSRRSRFRIEKPCVRQIIRNVAGVEGASRYRT